MLTGRVILRSALKILIFCDNSLRKSLKLQERMRTYKVETSNDHMLRQNISEESQEKISLMETMFRKKGSKSLSRLLLSAKSGWKKLKKCYHIRSRILYCKLSVLVKSFETKPTVKHWRPSIPDPFIDIKVDLKTENNFKKAELLGKFFISVFGKVPDWGKRKDLT